VTVSDAQVRRLRWHGYCYLPFYAGEFDARFRPEVTLRRRIARASDATGGSGHRSRGNGPGQRPARPAPEADLPWVSWARGAGSPAGPTGPRGRLTVGKVGARAGSPAGPTGPRGRLTVCKVGRAGRRVEPAGGGDAAATGLAAGAWGRLYMGKVAPEEPAGGGDAAATGLAAGTRGRLHMGKVAPEEPVPSDNWASPLTTIISPHPRTASSTVPLCQRDLLGRPARRRARGSEA
jgi:hypothetical protein